MSGEERALLDALDVDQDLGRLDSRLSEFNIFEAVGVVWQELRHSDFLAFLLDPNQNHGLGDTFLKRVLNRVLESGNNPPWSPVEIDAADLRRATVRREWQYIDILVLDERNRLVCAIENKISTGEHSDQLRCYRRVVANEFPGYRPILVFLTPDGTPPSDDAYIPLSYTDVAAVVDAVRQEDPASRKPEVAALMGHYTTMLRRHIVSDSDTAELCRRIYQKHQRALDLIYEQRRDVQMNLAEELKQLLKEGSPAFALALDSSVKAYVRFAVTDWDRLPGQLNGSGWTASKRILLFVFNNFPSGLSLGLYIGPGPEAVRQALLTCAQEHPTILNRRKREGPWWKIYERVFLEERDYADLDSEGLKAKLRVEWDRFLEQNLPAIHEVATEAQWPEYDSRLDVPGV